MDWTGNKKSAFVCNGASNHSEEERETNDYLRHYTQKRSFYFQSNPFLFSSL